MQNQKALIIVNKIIILVNTFLYMELPQNSQLSPILYLFFNLDLVYSIINKNKKVILFINNYIA